MQIDENYTLGVDIVLLSFIREKHLSTYKVDLYFGSYTSSNVAGSNIALTETTSDFPLAENTNVATNTKDSTIVFNLSKNPNLIFYVDRVIGFQRLYISLSLVKDILTIIYSNGHLGFQRCYKIVVFS